jgi:hypothetical protein
MEERVRRQRRLLAVAAGLAMVLLGWSGAQLGTAPPARAATNQFHGVNWADPRDNFLWDENVPVGLSKSDSYQTVYGKATAILKGFQGLGANTIRFGITPETTASSWWSKLTAAYDAASALGMNVMIAPWTPPNGSGRINGESAAFYRMWDTVISKYGSRNNFYFDMINEPWGYSATELPNLAADWLSHYPNVPRSRMVIPGLWSDQDICPMGRDSRLNGTLLSIHLYTLGGESHPTAAEWASAFRNKLCGFADRTVLSEFGVPMNTGVNYNGPRDGNNNVSYFYGLTDTVRSLGMGSLLWTGVKEANQQQGPGPCFNASCAITSLNGTSLSVTNQSGLQRLQYGWGGSPGGGSTAVLRGVGSNRCLDVPGATQANGTQLNIWDCTGGPNQQWTAQSNGTLQVYGSKCLEVPNHATTAGTRVQIQDCTGATNQQWRLNSDGTVTGVESGLCLDVVNAATTNGTAVEIWTCNGGSNQKWARQ